MISHSLLRGPGFSRIAARGQPFSVAGAFSPCHRSATTMMNTASRRAAWSTAASLRVFAVNSRGTESRRHSCDVSRQYRLVCVDVSRLAVRTDRCFAGIAVAQVLRKHPPLTINALPPASVHCTHGRSEPHPVVELFAVHMSAGGVRLPGLVFNGSPQPIFQFVSRHVVPSGFGGGADATSYRAAARGASFRPSRRPIAARATPPSRVRTT